jgi:hypothetical protein
VAPLSEGQLALLREAVDGRRKKEDLETALGRALRRRGEGFDAYVAIMSEVRELARRRKVPLDEAAQALTAEG